MNSILAIASVSRGFGFVVLDRGGRATDWGVKDMRRGDDASLLARAMEVIDAHCPDLLVIEDWSDFHPQAKRRSDLLQQLYRYAHRRKIPVLRFRRSQVRQCLGKFGVTNNRDLVRAVADFIPDLRPLMPRPRKPWQSEPYAMGIFRAASLAMSYAASHK